MKIQEVDLFELAKKLSTEDDKIPTRSSSKSPNKKKSNYTTNAALQSLGLDEAGTFSSHLATASTIYSLIYSQTT